MRRGYGAGYRAAALLAAESNGLAIDFTDLSMVVKDTGTPANNFSGDPNAKLTYAAPSTKYIRNASGVYVPGTTLRCEYDASGNPLGLLVEEQRTNLCLRNTELGHATWGTTFGITVTPDTTVAPDGTTTADTLAMGSAAYHYCQKAVIGAATQAYTASVWLKGTPGDKVGLHIQCAESGNGAAATLVTLTSTWTRYTVTSTITTLAGQSVHMGLETRSYIVAGTGVAATFQAWGAQLEVGSIATSPIITTGSQVTRAADRLSLSNASFPVPTSGATIYAEITPIVVGGTVLAWGDTAAGLGTVMGFYLPGLFAAFAYNTSATQSLVTVGSPATGVLGKVAAGYALNNFNVAADGVLGTDDTSGSYGTWSTSQSVFIGAPSFSGAQASYYLRKAMFLPRRMTNSELQARTA